VHASNTIASHRLRVYLVLDHGRCHCDLHDPTATHDRTTLSHMCCSHSVLAVPKTTDKTHYTANILPLSASFILP